MKTITVKQPWASLMFINNGYKPKDIENRTWKTKLRGKVLIHAGQTILRPQQCHFTDDQWDNIRGDMRYNILHGILPTSAIIGVVDIVDCVIGHGSIWAEETPMPAGCYMGEKPIYNWVLANPILFPEPIPAKGKLSFWDYPNILAEPEEKDGELFCHCQLPVKEQNQVANWGGEYHCNYCGGKWYK